MVTCNKIWLFQYDLEMKSKFMQWKAPASPRPKKAWMSKSNIKTLILVFFHIRWIILVKYIWPHQMVCQQFYIHVLTNYKVIQKKRGRFVESLLAFAVIQHNGAWSNFNPPLFSWKTNTNAPASSVFIISCRTWHLIFPELTVLSKEPIFGQLKTSIRKWQCTSGTLTRWHQRKLQGLKVCTFW